MERPDETARGEPSRDCIQVDVKPIDMDEASIVDCIRRRAFRLYEERIREHRPGSAESDWLQAEQDVRARIGLHHRSGSSGARPE